MSFSKTTRLKICGIKSADEAMSILNLNIDYLGLIFAKSKRAVDMKTAREISYLAHKYSKKSVGVFASSGDCGCVTKGLQSDCEIMEITEFCKLNVAQIYGKISQNLYLNLKDLGVEIWSVVSIDEKLKSKTEPCDMVLYDCKGKELGGNGISFNWNLLKDLDEFSYALAGGIDDENIKNALEFKPLVVDVNSKVEDENLIKIPKKIESIANCIKEFYNR